MSGDDERAMFRRVLENLLKQQAAVLGADDPALVAYIRLVEEMRRRRALG